MDDRRIGESSRRWRRSSIPQDLFVARGFIFFRSVEGPKTGQPAPLAQGLMEANYKGRITGSWAATRAKAATTISAFLARRQRRRSRRSLGTEREPSIEARRAQELFVLRRIGNIIIGVITSHDGPANGGDHMGEGCSRVTSRRAVSPPR